MEESVLSWLILTMSCYATFFWFCHKAMAEKEQRKAESLDGR